MEFKAKSAISLVLMFFSNYAIGAVVWDWEIHNPNVVVAPHETIVFYATIYNDINSESVLALDANISSEEDLFFLSIYEIDSNLLTEYTVDNGVAGPQTILSQFSGVELAPGDSYQFVLYTFAPTDGSAEIGTYSSISNTLSLTPATLVGEPPPLIVPLPYQIDAGAINITVVPLPSTFILFSTTLFLAFLSRVKKLTSLGTIALRAGRALRARLC